MLYNFNSISNTLGYNSYSLPSKSFTLSLQNINRVYFLFILIFYGVGYYEETNWKGLRHWSVWNGQSVRSVTE